MHMSQSIIFKSLLILMLDKQIFRVIFCIMKLSIQNIRLFVVLCGYPHNVLIKTNAVLNWKSSYP